MEPLPTGKKFWGPAVWRVIHDVSARSTYEHFFEFLSYLTHLLPCSECRQHLKANIPRLKKMMGSERDPLVGGYMLHNLVTRDVKALSGYQAQERPPTIPELRASLVREPARTFRAYVDALASMATTYVPSEAASAAYMAVYKEFLSITLSPGATVPPLEAAYLNSKVVLMHWTFLLHRASGLVDQASTFGDYKRYLLAKMGESCAECALD